ncbi:unnamed protein product, partial [Didymodactylos carnosus]
LLDTLPICRDFKSKRCTRPQCKYVHLSEEHVEVNNGFVTICKEAIVRNCSLADCKFYHITVEELQRQIWYYNYNKSWRSVRQC